MNDTIGMEGIMRTGIAALAAAALVAFGCGGGESIPEGPVIQPDRVQLNFGADFSNAVYVGTMVDETLQLKNGGEKPLEIGDITVTGPNADYFTYSINTRSVASLGKAFLTVTYAPKAAGKHSATLTVHSNSVEDAALGAGPKLEISMSPSAVVKN